MRNRTGTIEYIGAFRPRPVYGPLDVGRLLSVSPRTVSHLIDVGLMPGRRRLRGGSDGPFTCYDRAVDHAELARWLDETPGLEIPRGWLALAVRIYGEPVD